MTQRIFDVENEKDMVDLWSILPDDVVIIVKDENHGWAKNYCKFKRNDYSDKTAGTLFKINWHDKTEITRPIQEAIEEATKKDIGKMCLFWDDDVKKYGVLTEIEIYYHIGEEDYGHCRRLTKQEIKELC